MKMEKGPGEKRRLKERGREKRKDTGIYVTGKQSRGFFEEEKDWKEEVGWTKQNDMCV